MHCLPIRIIVGKRREQGYISDNHLNQTGQLSAVFGLFIP